MVVRVPLCDARNSEDGNARGPNDSKDRPKVKKKKRRSSGRGNDESENEPDLAEYPSGIMNVLLPPSPHSRYS